MQLYNFKDSVQSKISGYSNRIAQLYYRLGYVHLTPAERLMTQTELSQAQQSIFSASS